MHKWLVSVLLVATLALAGCTGDEGDDATLDTDEGSGLGTPDAAVPDLEASLSPSATEGPAPLAVTFDLAAVGNATSWQLDVDGDGSADAEGEELPADHSHEYLDPGTFEATFTVFGASHNATHRLAIMVLEPEVEIPEPEEFGGKMLMFDPTTDVRGCTDAPQVSGQKHQVKQEWSGWLYEADTAPFRTLWHDDSGLLEEGTESGTVPAGATWVYVCTSDPSHLPSPAGPTDPYVTYTFTVTHPLYEPAA